uniref:Zmp:0000001127 n=1 Tax=Neogobius melanostomus TaxID=47308 RepID=A0A8C6TZY2_9GOBI
MLHEGNPCLCCDYKSPKDGRFGSVTIKHLLKPICCLQDSVSTSHFDQLYSVSLLVLFSLWHGGLTVPVPSKEYLSDMCVSYAKALLDNITDNLLKGIDCTKQSVELNTKTDTPSVCSPHGTNCSGLSESQFNQKQCEQNIGEDLRYYYTFLSAHPDPDRSLSSTVLLSIVMSETYFKYLMVTRRSSYNERLSLCKELKGFQIRSITINRALGYMRSVEHAI